MPKRTPHEAAKAAFSAIVYLLSLTSAMYSLVGGPENPIFWFSVATIFFLVAVGVSFSSPSDYPTPKWRGRGAYIAALTLAALIVWGGLAFHYWQTANFAMDETDPTYEGCLHESVVQFRSELTDDRNRHVGEVRVRFSPECETSWLVVDNDDIDKGSTTFALSRRTIEGWVPLGIPLPVSDDDVQSGTGTYYTKQLWTPIGTCVTPTASIKSKEGEVMAELPRGLSVCIAEPD